MSLFSFLLHNHRSGHAEFNINITAKKKLILNLRFLEGTPCRARFQHLIIRGNPLMDLFWSVKQQ